MEEALKELIEIASRLNKLARKQALKLPSEIVSDLTEAEYKINKSISKLRK